MNKVTLGVLAHVDAGKTTLTEAILYETGKLRRKGRVDHGDAFLDYYTLEQERGITIFSKQAVIPLGQYEITLLDTPGHVDFSAEMERVLPVLDYTVLVISAVEGVQAHTRTLLHLLDIYHIPVFVFINKTDRDGADVNRVRREIQSAVTVPCVNFSKKNKEFYESIAICREALVERYLGGGTIQDETIRELISTRELIPCFSGSALRGEGIKELLEGLEQYISKKEYSSEFGARVFKISHDGQGNRLTHLKITGGCMKVRDILKSQEKVNQIRIYSGNGFEPVEEACAGTICAVTGLKKSIPGEGYGKEQELALPLLTPVLLCRLGLPEGTNPFVLLGKLRTLEEENPELHLLWNEKLQEIQVAVMGEVQTEILRRLIQERFGIEVEFGPGNVVYHETITSTVEGVGHFEPLKHYAEVHLKLEPGTPGSGMVYETDCSEDELDKNWQRLVMTHLYEKEHKGVLTGAVLTDVKITLIAGRAHKKHTEGGDFRQATYRAVRQGLMQAESVLLEPYYDFRLEIPAENVGRAITELEQLSAKTGAPELTDGFAVITGYAPVASLRGYQKEVTSYSKGLGHLSCTIRGYEPCHESERIISKMAYNPEQDPENPAGSVFCSGGSGFFVEWSKVKDYMHIEGGREFQKQVPTDVNDENPEQKKSEERWVGTEEIDAILRRTSFANQREKEEKRSGITRRTELQPMRTAPKKKDMRDRYLLVDGYNIIFAWEELRELTKINLDGARGRLLDILCNYQGVCDSKVIAVFDAYRVQGHVTEQLRYHNIDVVYTKEAETADCFIEHFSHQNSNNYNITVATSDRLEQVIICGAGCRVLNADEFLHRIRTEEETLREEYLET